MKEKVMTSGFCPAHRGGDVEIDIYDPAKYAAAVPHEHLKWLRNNEPVYFHPEPDGRGFWALTKYDDIVEVSKDQATFSSARGGTNISDFDQEALDYIRLMLVNMDPPEHGKYRKLIQKGFTPRMIKKLGPAIKETAKMLVDAIAEKGACEFVENIAAEMPLIVIADFVGMPAEDRKKVFNWTNHLLGFDDPEFSGCTIEEMRMAAMEVWSYGNELAEQRVGGDGQDLISVLLRADLDGEALSVMEFDAFFLLLALAGNETTRTALSGGLQALIDHPEQRQLLIDDPSLIPQAVEEMLRWVTPVQHFRRTATKDVVIRGQQIKEDDKVVMYYNSANRDEEHFENPYTFDVTRKPNDHLAFGVGEHFCIGAHLARLEMIAMFTELLTRIPDFEYDGPIRRLQSNFINGTKEMHIRYTPEK